MTLETTIALALSLSIICVLTPLVVAILLTLPLSNATTRKPLSTMYSKDSLEKEMLQNA